MDEAQWERDYSGYRLKLSEKFQLCVYYKKGKFGMEDNWVLTCLDLGFYQTVLQSQNIEEAKEEAARLVLQKIKMLTRELPTVEEKLDKAASLFH